MAKNQDPSIYDLNNGQPWFSQEWDGPAFCGSEPNDVSLNCTRCENILIANYLASAYIGIVIRCGQCGEMNRLPDVGAGEIFPDSVIHIGTGIARVRPGLKVTLKSAVTLARGQGITVSDVMQASIKAASPRRANPIVDLSDDGLDELISHYEACCPGRWALQSRVYARGGAGRRRKFPFLWSIEQFRGRQLEGKSFQRGADLRCALLWLALFKECVEAWSNHPRYAALAEGITKPESFLHTVFQLKIASMFYERGRQIGLSLEQDKSVSNPDLYIRTLIDEKSYIEVKALEALQPFECEIIKGGVAKNAMLRKIKNCTQLNAEKKGSLAFASSYIGAAASAMLRFETRAACKERGRIQRNIESIMTLNPLNFDIDMVGPTRLQYLLEMNVDTFPNMHFASDRSPRRR